MACSAPALNFGAPLVVITEDLGKNSFAFA
jgi:hypothetical protein